jgi:hypothetical protein
LIDEQRRRHAHDPARHREGDRHAHPFRGSQAGKPCAEHTPLECRQRCPFNGPDRCKCRE